MTDRAALWAAVCAAPDDDLPRLVFADWLEENGDPQLARYIRARRALDGDPFPAADYPDLFEQLLEAEAGVWGRKGIEPPEGFRLGQSHWGRDEWWADDHDATERGFPSVAKLGPPIPDGDEPAAAATAAARLPELFRVTPVRGLDVGSHVCGHLGTVLRSPAARHLRRLSFNCRPESGQPCPDIAALTASPVARTLTRLEIGHGILMSSADVDALAAAPFDALRRLDCHHVGGGTAAVVRLTAAPWFRRLRRLLIGQVGRLADKILTKLSGMPDLHTLCLYELGAAGGRLGKLPALARLYVLDADLTGDPGRAFGRVEAPRLTELWLRSARLKAADVGGLIGLPLFDKLRAVTFASTLLGQRGLAALATRPCAANLRILRLKYAGVTNLARTPLTRAGAFPALTTLVLNSPGGPGGSGAASGLADLLAGFAPPGLRHLELWYCDFDDACGAALTSNPAFAGLTRLTIRNGTMGAKAAEQMFRSDNLRNLVEFEISMCPIGKAAGALTDPAVMPALARGSISYCKVPFGASQRVQAARAAVYMSPIQ